MPLPANSVARSPDATADRMPTVKVPLPAASNQPTGDAYHPRSKASVSFIVFRASSGGRPPTAGVGWSASTSERTWSSSARPAVIDVWRCWTVASRLTVRSPVEMAVA
jgi:hypothetical protein